MYTNQCSMCSKKEALTQIEINFISLGFSFVIFMKVGCIRWNQYATYFLKACFKHWTLYKHLLLLPLFYYLWTANNGAGNMTWLGKAVNIKPKDLSSIPVTHMAERKIWLIALASIYMLLQGCILTPLHTYTKWNALKKFFKRVGL